MDIDAIIVMSLVTVVMGFMCFLVIDMARRSWSKDKLHHKKAK